MGTRRDGVSSIIRVKLLPGNGGGEVLVLSFGSQNGIQQGQRRPNAPVPNNKCSDDGVGFVNYWNKVATPTWASGFHRSKFQHYGLAHFFYSGGGPIPIRYRAQLKTEAALIAEIGLVDKRIRLESGLNVTMP